jgi:hypothetical protein
VIDLVTRRAWAVKRRGYQNVNQLHVLHVVFPEWNEPVSGWQRLRLEYPPGHYPAAFADASYPSFRRNLVAALESGYRAPRFHESIVASYTLFRT